MQEMFDSSPVGLRFEFRFQIAAGDNDLQIRVVIFQSQQHVSAGHFGQTQIERTASIVCL
jgi:hypothetical protein